LDSFKDEFSVEVPEFINRKSLGLAIWLKGTKELLRGCTCSLCLFRMSLFGWIEGDGGYEKGTK
jgi:hypothetical protein